MIFFILPVYNEEGSLRAIIPEIRHAMRGMGYKIICVDDGSTDGSRRILEGLKGGDLLVEGFGINMNIGAVFSAGLERALSLAESDDDVVVIMESDQTSSVQLVGRLVSELLQKGSDIAIASRYLRGGGYAHFPLLRRVASHCANLLMRLYFPIRGVRDYTIFFRAYRVRVLREAVACLGKFGLIQSKGFVANAELLVKLSFFTDRVAEIPFVYDYAKKVGSSKLRFFNTINEYFVTASYLRGVFGKLRRLKQ